MTLLELLRQELPKRGGWPEGAKFAWVDPDCEIRFDNPSGDFFTKNKIDNDQIGKRIGDERIKVTCEQYEATGWDGTGLPPVGCEIEYMKYQRGHNGDWFIGTINYISGFTVVISQKGHKGEIVGHPVNFQFRPLRTEAERAIDEMVQLSGVSTGAAKILYDAGYRK